MYRRIAALSAVALLVSGQTALAAESARVSGVTGSVMISQNGRFVPAANGAVLRAGDRIVASSGSAKLVYGDGCNVAISARSMATVAASSPCVGGSSGVVKVSTAAQSDDRDGEAGYGAPRTRGQAFWGTTAMDRWIWLTFGVITVGATSYAVDGDSDPVSP